MSYHDKDRPYSSSGSISSATSHTDHDLEREIARLFHERAEQIHFTPELRARILRRGRIGRPVHHRPQWSFAGLAVAALLLIIALGAISFPYSAQSTPSPIRYSMLKMVTVPDTLAHGGSLLSLDPTEQHLAYQPAGQAGVLYTADLANPVGSNALVMRDALDSSWAPDGSALVATIKPEGTSVPLLALAPLGTYMHPLAHNALAASWQPTAHNQIAYAIQEDRHIQLWVTTPTGDHASLQAALTIPLPVQRLIWSKNGQWLALVAANTIPSTSAQGGQALYVMNARTQHVQTIIPTGTMSIGKVAWSPDSNYLTYELTDEQGRTTLQTIDTANQPIFAIHPRGRLQGWSWSPNSQTLIYSDGGALHTYALHGQDLAFPQEKAQYSDPFWLSDGKILALRLTDGGEQLVYLGHS